MGILSNSGTYCNHSNESLSYLKSFQQLPGSRTEKMDVLCKQTYVLILTAFPWASIIPSLHNILAHSTELIRDCNDGYGLN